MATKRGGQLARRTAEPSSKLEQRIRRLESRVEQLIVNLNAPAHPSVRCDEIDGWLPPHAGPSDTRRVLVLSIMSNGESLVSIAQRPSIAGAKWFIEEGGGYMGEIRGWRPLPDVPDELRKSSPPSWLTPEKRFY